MVLQDCGAAHEDFLGLSGRQKLAVGIIDPREMLIHWIGAGRDIFRAVFFPQRGDGVLRGRPVLRQVTAMALDSPYLFLVRWHGEQQFHAFAVIGWADILPSGDRRVQRRGKSLEPVGAYVDSKLGVL